MKQTKLLILLIIVLISGCAKSRLELLMDRGLPSWQTSKILANEYYKVDKRSDRLKVARLGIEYGDKCAENDSKNPACYYFRAVNTGLYYQSKVVGYQKGLKSMIADCNMVIKLNPAFEYGGAYRILGQIYTEVPGLSLRKGNITKDLDKAVDYLKKAILIAPEYPENHISTAKTYLERDEKNEALGEYLLAKKQLPAWKDHGDYHLWRKDIKKLSKKLRKQIKTLHSAK